MIKTCRVDELLLSITVMSRCCDCCRSQTYISDGCSNVSHSYGSMKAGHSPFEKDSHRYTSLKLLTCSCNILLAHASKSHAFPTPITRRARCQPDTLKATESPKASFNMVRILCLHGIGTNGSIFAAQTCQFKSMRIHQECSLDERDANIQPQRASVLYSPHTGNGNFQTQKSHVILHPVSPPSIPLLTSATSPYHQSPACRLHMSG